MFLDILRYWIRLLSASTEKPRFDTLSSLLLLLHVGYAQMSLSREAFHQAFQYAFSVQKPYEISLARPWLGGSN